LRAASSDCAGPRPPRPITAATTPHGRRARVARAPPVSSPLCCRRRRGRSVVTCPRAPAAPQSTRLQPSGPRCQAGAVHWLLLASARLRRRGVSSASKTTGLRSTASALPFGRLARGARRGSHPAVGALAVAGREEVAAHLLAPAQPFARARICGRSLPPCPATERRQTIHILNARTRPRVR
jgi:hypothetical protein